jgi:CheY-like chemotaxis protein
MMLSKTILLAEDNPKDVELTLEALTEHDLAGQVTVVKDGVETMEFLRREGKYKQRPEGNPAVVLLDIKMPRMDGIETLRLIRTDPSLKGLPVVMLTSSREEQDLINTYNLGVNAYVVKPVGFKNFVEAVKIVGVFWAVINELPQAGGTSDAK